ncbi:hairy-related 9 isoform X2 [Hoplias malabaricus]|uniref:hairy-related 9 isoform X2 n=1 Tax=Hoplias malabaricus TaxID=27720 RepID=UPI00346196ED
MPADSMEKQTASPIAGAPASGSHTPDKPKSASEHRKSSKPIMEKRRRARINESLGQLKTLILDALKKDSSRHSKLEKADILEMTVKHLRNLQRVQMTAMSTDAAVLSKYRAGFNECVNEVTRFLSTCEGVSTEVRSRLLGHLSACLAQVIAASGYSHQAHAAQQAHAHAAAVATQPLHAQLSSSKLGVPAEAASPKVFGGFQLVPATDGQFAFLVPSPATFGSATAPVIPLYANAGLPLAVSAGPVHGSAAPTAASPVQGMTCFNGAARTTSPVGVSAGPESSEPVWRPW